MRRNRRTKGRGGFSLIELMLALTVLAIGAVSMIAVVSVANRVSTEDNRLSTAMNLAKKKLEEMQAYSFYEIFRRYNDSAADNPVSGASPGKTFIYVPGEGRNATDFAATGTWHSSHKSYHYLPNPMPKALLPKQGDPGVGTITMPAVGTQLREALTTVGGITWDMNFDGDFTDTFNYDDLTYRILPVTIHIEWAGVPGGGEYDLTTVLGNRDR